MKLIYPNILSFGNYFSDLVSKIGEKKIWLKIKFAQHPQTLLRIRQTEVLWYIKGHKWFQRKDYRLSVLKWDYL